MLGCLISFCTSVFFINFVEEYCGEIRLRWNGGTIEDKQ